jgi:hypothetical protein
MRPTNRRAMRGSQTAWPSCEQQLLRKDGAVRVVAMGRSSRLSLAQCVRHSALLLSLLSRRRLVSATFVSSENDGIASQIVMACAQREFCQHGFKQHPNLLDLLKLLLSNEASKSQL